MILIFWSHNKYFAVMADECPYPEMKIRFHNVIIGEINKMLHFSLAHLTK
jgi:hypothetical protein